MFGVEQFVAILNPPQAAILAVGATEDRAVVRDGQVVVRPMLTVTLTVDHRAVDGAPAAEFLGTVKTFLEEPALALGLARSQPHLVPYDVPLQDCTAAGLARTRPSSTSCSILERAPSPPLTASRSGV